MIRTKHGEDHDYLIFNEHYMSKATVSTELDSVWSFQTRLNQLAKQQSTVETGFGGGDTKTVPTSACTVNQLKSPAL
jgi:hypothetical protein